MGAQQAKRTQEYKRAYTLSLQQAREHQKRLEAVTTGCGCYLLNGIFYIGCQDHADSRTERG